MVNVVEDPMDLSTAEGSLLAWGREAGRPSAHWVSRYLDGMRCGKVSLFCQSAPVGLAELRMYLVTG